MSRSGQPPDLKKYMDKQLQIKLNANRMVVGTLRGFDQFMNLVVDNTVEVNGNEKTDIGMVVIRGNSVVTVEALEPVAECSDFRFFDWKCGTHLMVSHSRAVIWNIAASLLIWA
ncbi:putative small nuclear ribonucleoprotein G [Hibiscus syriacus]|uniref:Small nuclear ribonucleoprotein G n=1 Tax=Hibiscus syriacus TaxID=106335 RepID=A0A6A3BVD5_HIBSY|nr:probable small nuclear ribonucleoprotein G [Hibiscus syriacus]KAE8718972.1 putative small nuclear ribonucleoprotein G [Hibiscus syriacus]